MKIKHSFYLIFLAIGMVFVMGCSGEDPASSAFVHVTMTDNAFSPPVIKTFKGGKIRFVNIGNNPHNAIAVDKKWSTELTYGQSAMFRGAQTDVFFPEDGVYPFFCSFHSYHL